MKSRGNHEISPVDRPGLASIKEQPPQITDGIAQVLGAAVASTPGQRASIGAQARAQSGCDL